MQTKNKRQIFVALIAVLISVTLVAVAVYAATTVGNDVTVGGDLTVSGNATISGNATTTGNQVISGRLIVTGTSTLPLPAGSKIEMGTRDGLVRTQIWNSLPDSVLRLGSLTSDGDIFTTTSEGIVVYGENVAGDAMTGNDYSYARIKPDRYALYSKDDGGYDGYLFRVDLSSDDFYLKDNSGNTVFDFTRATGQLSIDGTIDVTGTTTLALTSGSVGIGTTTIGSKLVVQGSGNSSTTSALNVINSIGTSLLYVRDDGNVGIGRSDPESLLDIYSQSNNSEIRLITFIDNYDSTIRLIEDHEYLEVKGAYIRYDGGMDTLNLGINTGGDPYDDEDVLSISRISGDVGIGTTTPSSLLHIDKGNATSTVTVGSIGSVTCLKLRDSDDGGWTYCTVLNGAMNCTTTSCE